jgi:D-glycero-alpha-D-manno-heptose-7-phosphate kinase
MIISRAPLRISIGGGGTDLPSYYKLNGGFLISATINKYIFITVGETFNKRFLLKYSSYENVQKISNIKHPLFRETFKELKINIPINVSSHADIPAGSGLGSSGCFTVALIKALSVLKNLKLNKEEIAELASKIEIHNLKEPVGKQDQYSAAYGGMRSYEFCKNGLVSAKKIKISKRRLSNFKNSLSLFYTGQLRSSYKILSNQNVLTKKLNKKMIHNLDCVKEMGYQVKNILEKGSLNDFGYLLNDHWKYKKKRSSEMSNKKIDNIYSYALNNGALGGKLIGAGGGGFLMFWSKNNNQFKKAMRKKKLLEVDFKFEEEGVRNLKI